MQVVYAYLVSNFGEFEYFLSINWYVSHSQSIMLNLTESLNSSWLCRGVGVSVSKAIAWLSVSVAK